MDRCPAQDSRCHSNSTLHVKPVNPRQPETIPPATPRTLCQKPPHAGAKDPVHPQIQDQKDPGLHLKIQNVP